MTASSASVRRVAASTSNTAFVTGGAGYIGAATCRALAEDGWKVVVYDDLSTGSRSAVKWGSLVHGDIRDRERLAKALEESEPDVVLHLAAYRSVAESISNPAAYYSNNCGGTLTLLLEMQRLGLGKLVFASSCATYGQPTADPVDEAQPLRPISPYGRSKMMAEQIIADLSLAGGLDAVTLRYFNVAGWDPSCDLRPDEPTVIFRLARLASQGNGEFVVNGSDFATSDGSASRDFVHVADVARANALAATTLLTSQGLRVFNLGSGVGTSVLQLVSAFRDIAPALMIDVGPRRTGDPDSIVACIDKAREQLGWQPRVGMAQVIESILEGYRRHTQSGLISAGGR